MGANVALIFSGQYVRWVSNMRSTLAPGVDAWAVSLRYLMAAVVGSGGVLIAAYKYMQDKIVSQNVELAATKKFPRKKKARMSMKESAKFLMSSPYIRDLATLVISYGLCINVVEVSWKSKLKVRPCVAETLQSRISVTDATSFVPQQAFPNPNEYSAFMGNFSSATGTVTLVMMLLVEPSLRSSVGSLPRW
jgi:ATP:ADP antiporter, AAA family